ncbi:Clathrin/coatomer adaptor, adaptin-like protein [Paraphysoderma sedebokerense]|nr:Clathrin/coatomer adaptor, adaptin-like protein [Paraphysoderma sedebokerense]KAI9144415.1 Clathrin/coatomer adaptor, adaptin-like protein [Paraphysoderma sedebokerense]
MFEKNLSDLIRGIRANKSNPQKYIATCIDEIKEELKRPNDPDVKSTAVLKLVYLQMLGYDISWADFHIVEVMSLPKFHHKRIGYLAATQSFRQDTDVLMLCTNLIKKDLTSTTPFDSSVALSTLSIIVTSDLGRDLVPDLVTLLSHSKPYIRKKAVLVLYKVFLKYPDGLRLAWDRLKERLEDDDPGVVSATVTVICELAKKNPKNYLTLAPQLFFLLTASSNNWMLIKLIKMFASLTPLEPRLARKLLPPLTQLIQTSNAVSLLYECIYTVIVGGMTNPPDPHNENSAKSTGGEKLARLCVSKLRPFLEENDQNLKYVGLVAMAKLLEVHPRLILQSQELILRCVDDQDITIRMRALDIISRMVTANSLQAIVKHLLTHLFPSTPSSQSSIFNEPHYHRTLINLIVSMCSRDHYANLTDPEWYVQILLKLISIPNIDVDIDATIGEQFLDICIRGEALRKWAVQQLIEFLKDFCAARRTGGGLSPGPNNSISVKSIAWIVGEYCGYHSHPFEILRGLLDVAENGRVENEAQTVIVHNVLKVYTFWSCSLLEDLEKSLDSVAGKIDEGFGITDGSVGTDEASEFIKVTNWLRERTKEVWNGNTDLEVVERVRILCLILFSISRFHS